MSTITLNEALRAGTFAAVAALLFPFFVTAFAIWVAGELAAELTVRLR